MNNRELQRSKFLHDHGWGNANSTVLPADLSFRRYFRLRDGARNAMLMDSPPDKENIAPYVKIDHHLAALGFSVPEIMSLDETAGFAIIEDFGDDTYTNLLKQGANERPLYELAIDTLASLHGNSNAAKIDIPHYSIDLLITEVMRFTEWFYPSIAGKEIDTSTAAEFEIAWRDVFANLPEYPKNIVLRDYHVDNLMILEGRTGIKRCGILDFQDAVLGHPAYDLTSLLEDARRDITDELRTAMRQRYTEHFSQLNGDNFDRWYDVLSAQRHAKILAHFNRFHLRDNNDSKLKHIPRVMKLLRNKLTQPCLQPVGLWFDTYLPNFGNGE